MPEPTAVNPYPHPGRVAGGRKGATLSWITTTDRTKRTQPARNKVTANLMAEVRAMLEAKAAETGEDISALLADDAEISRRAEALRRVKMADLSKLAAQARKIKAEMRALENSLGDGPA